MSGNPMSAFDPKRTLANPLNVLVCTMLSPEPRGLVETASDTDLIATFFLRINHPYAWFARRAKNHAGHAKNRAIFR
jgi:hypothetical protein